MRDPDTCRAASTGFSPKAEILEATPKRASVLLGPNIYSASQLRAFSPGACVSQKLLERRRMTTGATYRPRHFSLCGIRSAGPLLAKVYEILAEGREAGDVDRAIDHIARHVRDDLFAHVNCTGVGYIVIHRGEMADWLLARTWLEGGIVAGVVYNGDGRTFEKVSAPLIECVWEAVAASHERGAWIRAGMSVAGQDQYLSDTLPAGYY
jgi:hypothetical protein